jgi:hypothetical protein
MTLDGRKVSTEFHKMRSLLYSLVDLDDNKADNKVYKMVDLQMRLLWSLLED